MFLFFPFLFTASTCYYPPMDQDHMPAWNQKVENVLDTVQTDVQKGLTAEQSSERLHRYGSNRIQSKTQVHWFVILIRQFNGLLVYLLTGAAFVSFFSGDTVEGVAIFLVLVINGLIGFITEMQAVKSMQALRKLGEVHTQVLRDGRPLSVAAHKLVPGDILVLAAGDMVTADARLIEVSEFEVDESTLTGESLPVQKNASVVLDLETPIADRDNMIMRGTAVTKGSATAVVVETGMSTQLGRIAALTASAKEEVTPLEKKLDRLAQKLVYLTLVVAAGVFLVGWLTGKDALVMLKTAIALAVATVPEGLPIVATLALARGLLKMAHQNALINRLSAVETLGSTTIIVTDKTGTLTENKMTVAEVDSVDPALLQQVAILCNNSQLHTEGYWVGDPMEVALKIYGDKKGVSLLPRLKEFPFNAERKMMATLHLESENQYLYAIKGAPESILQSCTKILAGGNEELLSEKIKDEWIEKNQLLAQQGLRILAFARKEENQSEGVEAFSNLTFLGLVGFRDPARADVPAAIKNCQRAGIRVVMATGDQEETAKKIAQDVGLEHWQESPLSGYEIPSRGDWPQELVDKTNRTAVLSRVNPEQKLHLVDYLQKQGAIVAMTGDGVNDAPALKKADIGIAMGIRGTEVAKEASDMVLRDDRFATIVKAIEQGRVIFNNIRKFVVYLLSCNLSEVFIVAFASAFSGQIPITPLQILFLNLITDVFPALALGLGKGEKGILLRPPRPVDEKVLTTHHWKFIFTYGFVITVLVLGLFVYAQKGMNLPMEKAISLAFLTLGLTQLFHVFNLHSRSETLCGSTIVKNPYVWGAIVTCGLAFLVAFSVPILRQALSLSALTLTEVLISIGVSLGVLLPALIIPKGKAVPPSLDQR